MSMPRSLVLFLFLMPFVVMGQVTFESSNLPIISINTLGQPIIDEPKITAQMRITNNGPDQENRITDQPNDYNGLIGIELRGSTSQWFPKKPYGVETRDNMGNDLDVSLLGMPKESDWTLNASYNDKTLLRDGLYYILAGSFMDYAPRVRYSEMLLNGRYEGVYLMVEKIKRGKNRVDIDKLETTDNTGDALTGGYILKLDKETGSNAGAGWSSSYPAFPGAWQRPYFQFEYPDARDVTAAQRSYITGFISQMEQTIASEGYTHPQTGYRKYIDTRSLADFIIVNELAKNPDAYRLSTFFYKERDSDGGKVHFGPVWDNNLGFGNVDYCTQGTPDGLVITNFNLVCPDDGWVIHFWWKKFLDDEAFYRQLKLRWKELRRDKLSDARVHFVIDSIATMLKKPQGRNFQQWPVLGQYVWPNFFVGQSYDQEISWLKNWMNQRLVFLDKEWEVREDSIFIPKEQAFAVTPNPAETEVTVTFRDKIPETATFFIVDLNGRLAVTHAERKKYQVIFRIDDLAPGLYFVVIRDQDKNRVAKFIKS